MLSAQVRAPENLRVGNNTAGIPSGEFVGDADTLSPYRDSISAKEARHWLTHAAFGGSEEEVAELQRVGLDAFINRWVYGPQNPDIESLRTRFSISEDDPENAWAVSIIEEANPLHERVALILHDVLATSCNADGRNSVCIAHANTIRSNALGNWRTLLKEITTDYLMLSWLNGRDNRRGSPDENYSREFWELFSLGETTKFTRTVRLYDSLDIEESSRAFTGWRQYTRRILKEGFTAGDGTVFSQGDIVSYSRCNELREILAAAQGVPRNDIPFPCNEEYYTALDNNRFDADPKTIWQQTSYEQTGSFGAYDMVDLTLDVRPEAAEWIAMRLFSGLVHNFPDRSVTTSLAKIIREDRYDLKRAIATTLKSQAMFSTKAYKGRYKDGGTFLLGFLRKTGMYYDQNRIGRRMSSDEPTGYKILHPNSVNGWPHNKIEEGAAGSAYFLGWLPEFANSIERTLDESWNQSDGKEKLDSLIGENVDYSSGAEIVDRLAVVFDVSLKASERAELIDYYHFSINSSGDRFEVDIEDLTSTSDEARSKIHGLIWLITAHRDYMMY